MRAEGPAAAWTTVAPLASPCPVCRASTWDPLPDPHDARSMLSDLRVVNAPLDKWVCGGCALVRRRTPVTPNLFAGGYELYAHSPGAPRETERQAAYASWIAASCPSPPRAVLDVGCGNGSLLLALGKLWPSTALRGVDLSPESTAHARNAGVHAVTGTLASSQLTAGLVIAVNVLEHVESPSAFVSGLADAVENDGELVIVCPDGSHPWSQLLIADHLWSFTATHLARVLDLAGIAVTSTSFAPPSIGRFVMVTGRRSARNLRIAAERGSRLAITETRNYLRTWRDLDLMLSARASGGRLACFGIGEAAGLLRAYAPRTWQGVRRCVVDAPERDDFGDLPVNDYRCLEANAEVLLGVRPQDQPRIVARLEADGHRAIRWDDIVTA